MFNLLNEFDEEISGSLIRNQITTLTTNDIIGFSNTLSVCDEVKTLVEYIVYDNYGTLSVVDSFYYLLHDLPGIYIADSEEVDGIRHAMIELTTSLSYYRNVTHHYWESENLYFISDELFDMAYGDNFPDESYDLYVWHNYGESLISLVSRSTMALINRIFGAHLGGIEENITIRFMLSSKDDVLLMGPVYEI